MKKITAAFAMLVITTVALAVEDGRPWLLPLQVEMNADSGAPVPPDDNCEVPETSRSTALSRLSAKTHTALSQAEATSLVGGCIEIEKGKTPYLVRAVYGHRGTGKYVVRRVGSDLVVAHESLGHYATYTKSALVVNLPFRPRQVFITVGIDE